MKNSISPSLSFLRNFAGVPAHTYKSIILYHVVKRAENFCLLDVFNIGG